MQSEAFYCEPTSLNQFNYTRLGNANKIASRNVKLNIYFDANCHNKSTNFTN